MNKFKIGDRFIVRIDEVIHGKNYYGEFTDYILNAETKDKRRKIRPIDGCVVTEGFLEQCSPFDVITNEEIVKTKKHIAPCPFCGCKMHFKKSMMADGRTVRYVPTGHHKQGCQLQFADSAFVGNPTSLDSAIKKWNKRYKETTNPDNPVCENCSHNQVCTSASKFIKKGVCKHFTDKRKLIELPLPWTGLTYHEKSDYQQTIDVHY